MGPLMIEGVARTVLGCLQSHSHKYIGNGSILHTDKSLRWVWPRVISSLSRNSWAQASQGPQSIARWDEATLFECLKWALPSHTHSIDKSRHHQWWYQV